MKPREKICRAVEENRIDKVEALCKLDVRQERANSAGKDTALRIAVLEDKPYIVERLIHYGADPTQKDECKKNALVYAIEKNNWACLYALAQSPKSLFYAIEKGDAVLVQCLLEAKASVEVTNAFGDTPLRLAIVNRHEAIVELLLKADAQIESSYLHAAIRKKNTTIIQSLLPYLSKANLIAKNAWKQTPFELAVSLRAWKEIYLLLTHPSITQIAPCMSEDLLKAALLAKEPEVVERLIEVNADITWKDKNWNSVLHLAVQSNLPTVIEALLKKRFDASLKNLDGQTALDLAIALGHWPCIDVFVKHTMENKQDIKREGVQKQDLDNYGALLVTAAKMNHKKTVRLLLAAGADVKWRTLPHGNTALHWAIINAEPLLVAKLLKAGSDLKKVNQEGLTPLALAAELLSRGTRLSLFNSRRKVVLNHIKEYQSSQPECGQVSRM